MMSKIITAFIALLFIPTAMACTNSVAPDDPNFCASFEAAATCYCKESTPAVLAPVVCKSMKVIHLSMIGNFRNLQNACEYQKHIDPTECVYNWNCYLHGGRDSQGKVCNACP